MDDQTIQKLNMAISGVFILAAAILFGAALKHRTVPPPETTSTASAVSAEAGASATATAITKSAQQVVEDLGGMKELSVAASLPSWTPDAKVASDKMKSASLAVTGRIAKAYLNVKASVDGKPLSKYESVFVKFDGAGGHLFRPQSLATASDGASTDLLYELSALPVLPKVPYDETRSPQKEDVAALLADGKSVKLTAFISSLRPAMLDALSLSYVCADGSDCAISVK